MRPSRRIRKLQKRMLRFTEGVPVLSISAGAQGLHRTEVCDMEEVGSWFWHLLSYSVHCFSCEAAQSCKQTWDPVARCGAHNRCALCLEESSLCISSDECKKTSLGDGEGSIAKGVVCSLGDQSNLGQFVISEVQAGFCDCVHLM